MNWLIDFVYKSFESYLNLQKELTEISWKHTEGKRFGESDNHRLYRRQYGERNTSNKQPNDGNEWQRSDWEQKRIDLVIQSIGCCGER